MDTPSAAQPMNVSVMFDSQNSEQIKHRWINQLHNNSWWNIEHRGVPDHELELEVSNIFNKDQL